MNPITRRVSARQELTSHTDFAGTQGYSHPFRDATRWAQLQDRPESNLMVYANWSRLELFVIKTYKTAKSPNNVARSRPPEIKVLLDHIREQGYGGGHRNIIDAFFDMWWQGDLHLCMELCDGGDLERQLNHHHATNDQPLPDIFALHAWVHISQALAFLHHGLRVHNDDTIVSMASWQPVVHGKISTTNILLRWHTNNEHSLPDLVLSGFDEARILYDNDQPYDSPPSSSSSTDQTLDHLKDPVHSTTPAKDIWAFALVMWRILTGRPIAGDGVIHRYEIGFFACADMYDWLLRMLDVDPETRIRLQASPGVLGQPQDLLSALPVARQIRDDLARQYRQQGRATTVQDLWAPRISSLPVDEHLEIDGFRTTRIDHVATDSKYGTMSPDDVVCHEGDGETVLCPPALHNDDPH